MTESGVLRVKFIVILLISVTGTYFLKYLDWFDGFTTFTLKAYHVTQGSVSPDSSIVIIAVTEDDSWTEDSIGTWIRQVASYRPRVIAVDFGFSDSTLHEKFVVDPEILVVQAIGYDKTDTLHAVPIVKGKMKFGNVFLPSDKIWLDDDLKYTLPWIVAEAFSPERAEGFRIGGHQYRNIKYPLGESFYIFEPAMIPHLLPEMIEDKIVLIGYFGLKRSGFVPGVRPGKFDNADVHETLAGYTFGSFILVSWIHNILYGSFLFSSPYFDVLIVVLVSIICASVILAMSKINKKVLYFTSKLLMLIFVALTSTLSFYVLHHYNILVDCQSYCTAAIIASEVSFWSTLK